MTRVEKILRHINLERERGLEFGPLANPVVPRDRGRIAYVDRACRAELIQWFADNRTIDPQKIEEVDYVWGDRTLKECVGDAAPFDFCIASHVMEHVPDLVTWLEEVSAVLRDGGILSVVLPDKRYTFDCLRTLTTAVDLVDAHVNRWRRPSARQIFDHFSHFVEVDPQMLWQQPVESLALRPTGDDINLIRICREAAENRTYIDSHCWVFTPSSFLDVLCDMARLRFVEFEVVDFVPTSPGEIEFFVSLCKLPSGLGASEKAERLRASVARARAAESAPPDTPLPSVPAAPDPAWEARLSAIERELETMKTSRSWRLTAPLRAAGDVARRFLARSS